MTTKTGRSNEEMCDLVRKTFGTHSAVCGTCRFRVNGVGKSMVCHWTGDVVRTFDYCDEWRYFA